MKLMAVLLPFLAVISSSSSTSSSARTSVPGTTATTVTGPAQATFLECRDIWILRFADKERLERCKQRLQNRLEGLKREEGAAKEAVKSAKLVLDNALTELLNKLDTQKKYAEQTTQAKKTLIELGQHNVKRKIGDEMDSLRSRITVIERRIANLP